MKQSSSVNLEKIKQAVKKNNQILFMSVAVVFLLVLICLSFLVLLSSINLSSLKTGRQPEMIIGGDKDEGGCLIGAGYSWCAVKNKCLRIWEEPCEAENLSDEDLARRYISENISFLVPANNGRALNISEINFMSDKTVFVGYDDGEDFYNAEAVFNILPDKSVKVEKFIVKNKNGYEYGLQSCESDSDCLPLPSDCHPRVCINKKYASKFEKPEVCNLLFDNEAAYNQQDCACDLDNKECYNKNLLSR